ncbi:UNVERIFIED_CONTAM: hypothetical protein FKN15_061059 [Acipenser sinensis]
MTGRHKVVLSLLQKDNTAIYRMGCPCHLSTLAAKERSKALKDFDPNDFMIDLFYHFDKRKYTNLRDHLVHSNIRPNLDSLKGDSFVVNAYITRRGLEECDKYNGPENRVRDRQRSWTGSDSHKKQKKKETEVGEFRALVLKNEHHSGSLHLTHFNSCSVKPFKTLIDEIKVAIRETLIDCFNEAFKGPYS